MALPKEAHILNPKTYDYVTRQSHIKVANGIKVTSELTLK